MVLFSCQAEINTSFLYFTLSQKCHTEILHDEHIIRRYSKSSLKEYNSFFNIPYHRISPSKVAENFWIVWCFCVRFFETLYSPVKIIMQKGHISPEVETSRRLRIEFFSIIESFPCFFVISFIYIDIRELFIEFVSTIVFSNSSLKHYTSFLITFLRLESLYFIDDWKFMIHTPDYRHFLVSTNNIRVDFLSSYSLPLYFNSFFTIHFEGELTAGCIYIIPHGKSNSRWDTTLFENTLKLFYHKR